MTWALAEIKLILVMVPLILQEDIWSFRTDAVCPYDSNYVKGEWVKISKGPQDCLNEGYRLQSDWPKPTAALEIPKSNALATLFNNLIGIKSAHATTATSDDLMDTQINVIGGGGGTSIRPEAGEQVKDKSDVTFDKEFVINDKLLEKPDDVSEAVLTFKVTAYCPYDSRYVIGTWVSR